jgi:hypothetical protein
MFETVRSFEFAVATETGHHVERATLKTELPVIRF